MARRLVLVLAAMALVAGASTRAPAAEDEITWYMIEMIVFERTAEDGKNAEAWPAEPGLPNLADAIELTAEGLSPEELARGDAPREVDASQPAETTVPKPLVEMPRAYRLVPPEEYRLTEIRERLEKSSAYRPLLQVAWIQPGLPVEDSLLVHLRNGNGALGTVQASADGSATTPANDAGFTATLSPRISVARDPTKPALDGTVRVHRARYLHVEADLLYYRPVDGSAAGDTSGDSSAQTLSDSPDTAFIEQLLAEDQSAARLFRLNERRRMRSKELHYLDHPLFGVLVEAWPLELPEAPAEPLPAESETEQTPPAAPAQTQPTGGGG